MIKKNCRHCAIRSDWERSYPDELGCLQREIFHPRIFDCDGCEEFDENPLMRN